MKKIILLIIIILSSGCSSYTELNELGIVKTLGIDYIDNKIVVVINFLNTNQENEPILESITGKGINLDEAIKEAYLKTTKKIYLSHLDLLIIGEKAIDNELSNIVNYFLNAKNSRNSFDLVLLKDYTISDFFNQITVDQELINFIKINYEQFGTTKNISFQDFLIAFYEKGIDAILPVLTLKDNKIKVDNLVALNDGEHIFLTMEESIIYNLLNNNINNFKLNTFCSNNQGIVNIQDNTTSVELKDNLITIRINNSYILEKKGCSFSNNQELNTNVEKELKIWITNFIDKIINKDLPDVIGYQNLFYKKNHSYYLINKNELLQKFKYKIIINSLKKENR